MSVARFGRRPLLALLMASLIVAAAGCADRTAPRPFESRGSGEGPAVIEVTSNQYLDVVIYMGSSGAWHRLGTVTGLATGARLTVPAVVGPLPGQYSLRVHAIGSSPLADYYSSTISLGPGDVVDLRVASDLRLSSWSIKPEPGDPSRPPQPPV